jgi:hypothetical protein
VLADSAYGDAYEFRKGLRSRESDYVVQVRGELTGWTQDPHPDEPPTKRGCQPRRLSENSNFLGKRAFSDSFLVPITNFWINKI